jgi:hypothetical protein
MVGVEKVFIRRPERLQYARHPLAGRGIAFEQRGLNGQKKGILEEAPDSREA